MAFPRSANKHRKNRKRLPREHLIGFRGVKMFLLNNPLKVFFPLINGDLSQFKFCHNLSIWFLSQFDFFSFVTIWVLSHFLVKFCHNYSFSQFELLSFITIWVFELHHNLSFLVTGKPSYHRRKHGKIAERCPSTSHRFSRCQVFLTKRPF